MDYEVDFHPVGDASKAGDAISVRYGQNGRYEVVVIDGGTEESGEALVENIKHYYGPETVVAHAISSHPDTDHASGLRPVLRQLPVRNLWIHQPWKYAPQMLPFYANKQLTADGLVKRLKSEYPIVCELIDLAEKQQTNIAEPFQGMQVGPFTVLSPSSYAYQRLVPQFRKGPEADVEALKAAGWWLGEKQLPNLLERLIEKAATWIDETWDLELLRENAVTAAENETSTVLFADFGSGSVVLTADAGVNALLWTCGYAEKNGIDLGSAGLVQMPHHGSRSNVTPTVLNRLLGPKLGSNAETRKTAVVSCPKDDEKHPRKMVVNAFKRRGVRVFKTQGQSFRHHGGTMPSRGWVAATPFTWFDKVEAYDD
jgi:hypothetical protein